MVMLLVSSSLYHNNVGRGLVKLRILAFITLSRSRSDVDLLLLAWSIDAMKTIQAN